MKILKSFAILGLLTISFLNPALAQSCGGQQKSCSAGEAGCGKKDYLDASEAEIALLGKETFHANIAMIEKALKEKGVALPEKGFITSEFRSALISFQESVKLPATGEINQPTLDKLGVKF